MKSVRLGSGGMYTSRGGGMLKMRGGGGLVEDKGGRAGPGTGSMGGKCSVCGDRATKVGLGFLREAIRFTEESKCNDFFFINRLIEFIDNSTKSFFNLSFATVCTQPPHASHVELSSGGLLLQTSLRASPADPWESPSLV